MSDKGSNKIELLGLVADHQRNIKNGYEFNHLFPSAKENTVILKRDGTVRNTVSFMDKIVNETLGDTAKLAPMLKGKNIAETCENIWNFIYNHIQYKLDDDGVEQLRKPSRSWHDRTTGVDCDCMSIFTSSVLSNLGIKHKFRITKYSAGWQHVYVIVPLPNDSRKYYVIDCVLNRFNYEKPYTDNFDYTMTPTTLSGIPITMLGALETQTVSLHDEIKNVLNGSHFSCLSSIDETLLGNANSFAQPAYDAIYKHIVATRDIIRKSPDSVVAVGGAKAYLAMLDYAIANWNTPNRSKALDVLAEQEEKWNKQTENINGVDDVTIEEEETLFDFDGEMLGKLKIGGSGKKFFSNIKNSVQAVDKFNKNLVKKVGGKAGEKIVAATEKVQAKAKEAAKKVGAAIKKFIVLSNPLTLMMRAGVLMAMKTNIFQMAERLYPALISQADADKAGITSELRERSMKALDKVAKVFEAIGGKRSKLEKFIKQGRAAKKFKTSGLTGIDDEALLGEPYTAAATIISAAATIMSAAAKMKQSNLSQKEYKEAKKKHPKYDPKKDIDDDVEQIDVDQSISGLGEGESQAPSPEQTEAMAKSTMSFIEMIKKWFSKNKKVATEENATEVIEQEQAEAPVIEDNGKVADGSGESSEGGMFKKIGTFVKENPVPVAIGTAVVVGGLVLALSPKARAAVGIGKKPKLKSPAALSGVTVYRKGKKIKKVKRVLPKNSKVKRIVLK